MQLIIYLFYYGLIIELSMLSYFSQFATSYYLCLN